MFTKEGTQTKTYQVVGGWEWGACLPLDDDDFYHLNLQKKL